MTDRLGKIWYRVFILLSALTLLIGVFYILAYSYLTPYPGLSFDGSTWEVYNLDTCDWHPGWCESNPAGLNVGDRILSIAGLELAEYQLDGTLVPFDGYGPGDLVSLTIEQNGEIRTVDWLMPEVSISTRIVRLLSMMPFAAFYLAGMLVLLMIRPQNERWRLLILFNYITAIWYAAGVTSSYGTGYASPVMHAASWLMVPIYLHLHLVVPSYLIKEKRHLYLIGLYSICVVLALLDFFQVLPALSYWFALLIAIGGSLCILIYRSYSKLTQEDHVAARLMLSGIILAFVPGIILFVLPVLLNADVSSIWATAITFIAIPALPLTYTYAIFKKQFGNLEFRANRVLGLYSFLLVYITAYVVFYFIGSTWIEDPEGRALLALFIALIFVIAAPTLRDRFQRLVERLAYGSHYDPDEILSHFSASIPAASDPDKLVRLLSDEVTPSLYVRQSALYLLFEGTSQLMYARNIGEPRAEIDVEDLKRLMRYAGEYRPLIVDDGVGESFQWVHLAIVLSTKERLVGIWLFGQRDPDDYYPQKDIDLLSGLGNQVALAIENIRLYSASKRQMEELAGLYDIAVATGSVLDRKVLLQHLYEQIAKLIDHDTFVIALHEPSQDSFEIVMVIEEGENLKDWMGVRIPMSEGGLTGWVMRSGQSLLINDLENDQLPIKPRHQNDPPAKSWLGVPLLAHDRLIGAVSIQSFGVGNFNQTDQRFMEAVAGQLAIALENSMLFDETRQRAMQQEAINAVIAAVAAATEFSVLLDISLDQSMRALDVSKGVVWIREPKLEKYRGLPIEYGSVAVELVKIAEEQGGILVVDDWSDVPITRSCYEFCEIHQRLGLGASLSVPLHIDDRRMGGLTLVPQESRAWTSEEIALAKAIGQQLAGAMERLRLLDQIQENARQVQLILDTVDEGILTLDKNFVITLANPAAELYLENLAGSGIGVKLEAIAGRPIQSFLHPRPGGIPWKVTLGEPATQVFEIKASPVTFGAASNAWTLLIREVTEAHRMQEMAQQQDRLAAVGQLAAGIAHDFNNIMAAITLYAEMLLNQANLGKKDKERLVTILQQSQRAATLVRQILDFSRRAVMERHPMDLIPFLKELENLLVRTLPENIQLNVIYRDEDYLVDADPSRLQQVFMNLALNARDAMLDGGELTFHLEKINLEPSAEPPIRDMLPGEWVQIVVKDSGDGIPPDLLPHIFEPFFTTKPPGEGTGLGLAQVYGIVRQHDGYIDAASEPGVGTTFTFYLPLLLLQEYTQTPQTPLQLSAGSGQTILVVEDDLATREGVRDVLEAVNYRVLVAVNGEDALRIFDYEGENIDLVVTDLVMPGMGGMALFQSLRDQNPDIRVVMMTGYPLGVSTRELLQHGEVVWVQKPLSSQILCNIVRDALQGNGDILGGPEFIPNLDLGED